MLSGGLLPDTLVATAQQLGIIIGFLSLAAGAAYSAIQLPGTWRRYKAKHELERLASAEAVVAAQKREEAIDRIVAEFGRNGGSSMRDRVEYMATGIDELWALTTELGAWHEAHDRRVFGARERVTGPDPE